MATMIVCIDITKFLNAISINSSFSSCVNALLCKILICLMNVDLPASPVPGYINCISIYFLYSCGQDISNTMLLTHTYAPLFAYKR